MTRNEIIEQVNELLAEEFEVETSVMSPDANIKETLSLDSLSLVDLVSLVHVQYNIVIPAEDIPTIKTFNNLYDYIEARLPQA